MICETYTPRELIREAAQLRTNLSAAEIEQRVDNLIQILNLEECQDVVAGGTFTSGITAK